MKSAIPVALLILLGACSPAPQSAFSGPVTDTARSADGVPIVYEVQGEGEPALVFVHGWAGYRKEWEPQLSYFSGRHRVVALDLAGHGESGDDRQSWTVDAFGEDVAAVVNQLGLDSVVLIGHSMGTPVILEAALRIPEKIVALIPVDMLHNVESTYSAEQIDAMVERYMDRMREPTRESLSAWFTARMDSAVIDNYVRYCQASAQQHWVAWEQSLREVLQWVSSKQLDVLRRTRSPVVCINADYMPTNLEIAAEYLESVDARIIDGVGHSIHWEVPDEFNGVLDEILSDLTGENIPATAEQPSA